MGHFPCQFTVFGATHRGAHRGGAHRVTHRVGPVRRGSEITDFEHLERGGSEFSALEHRSSKISDLGSKILDLGHRGSKISDLRRISDLEGIAPQFGNPGFGFFRLRGGGGSEVSVIHQRLHKPLLHRVRLHDLRMPNVQLVNWARHPENNSKIIVILGRARRRRSWSMIRRREAWSRRSTRVPRPWPSSSRSP